MKKAPEQVCSRSGAFFITLEEITMATAETTTKQKAYRNKLITLVHVA